MAQKKINELSHKIDTFKNDLNKIINIFNNVIEKIEEYFKISSNIINGINIKNSNNYINKNNYIIIEKYIDAIIEDENLINKTNYTFRLYENLNNEKIIKDSNIMKRKLVIFI